MPADAPVGHALHDDVAGRAGDAGRAADEAGVRHGQKQRRRELGRRRPQLVISRRRLLPH